MISEIVDWDVIVIGGGAAGMMAAAASAGQGRRTLLLEKNAKVGRKLGICGKGRCNITNSADFDGLMSNIPGNGKFLYSTFNAFSNTEIIEFFNKNGVETKVERGGRVFPVSDRAGDVVGCMKRCMERSGVKIAYEENAKEIITENEAVAGVRCASGKIYRAGSVILATGGMSYSATGSDGSGYALAKALGHTITEPKPSLVPLVSPETAPKELQGLSLRNVRVDFYRDGKMRYTDFGEMLFTHFGVTGPVILSGSRHYNQPFGEGYIEIDLKPALDEQQLDRRIMREFDMVLNRSVKNAFDSLLPQKMIDVFIRKASLDPEKKINSVTKEERASIVHTLKHFRIEVSGTRPINEAIITSGGVAVKEINPRTMESKMISGLFFAGEIIDVDGYTGGFNLTIAFSTGYTAGINA